MKRIILLVIISLLAIISTYNIVFADLSATEFSVTVNNGVGKSTERVKNEDTAHPISKAVNSKVPVNYYYWVSTPAVWVTYNPTYGGGTGAYIFRDAVHEAPMWAVGNGDAYIPGVGAETYYTKDQLKADGGNKEFNSLAPNSPYAIDFEQALAVGHWYNPAQYGTFANEYNVNGNPNYYNRWKSGTTSLVDVYNDSEGSHTVGGHIDYWSNLSTSQRFNMRARWTYESDDVNHLAQYPVIPVTYGSKNLIRGTVRVDKSVLQQCVNNPNTPVLFTYPHTFFSYRDVNVEGDTETTTKGSSGSSSDDETESTTADLTLANPTLLTQDTGIRANDTIYANYKFKSGNISAKVQGSSGMQAGKNSKYLKRLDHRVGVKVFNGDDVTFKNQDGDSDSTYSWAKSGGYDSVKAEMRDKAPYSWSGTFTAEFESGASWMYTDRDGNLGFQLVGKSEVDWFLDRDGVGDNAEYAAVEWYTDIFRTAKSSANSKSSKTTVTVSSTDTDEVLVKVTNEKPSISGSTDGTKIDGKYSRNSTVKLKINYNDFEKDILLSELKIKNPNGVTVLDFQAGATSKLNTVLDVSNVVTSTETFEADIVFTDVGNYTWEATVTDLASKTTDIVSKDGNVPAGAGDKLVRYVVSNSGYIEVAMANPPEAMFTIATDADGKLSKNECYYSTSDLSTDIDSTLTRNDISDYYWEIVNDDGSKINDISSTFEIVRSDNSSEKVSNPCHITTGNKYSNSSEFSASAKNSRTFDIAIKPLEGGPYKVRLYCIDSKGLQSNVYEVKIMVDPDSGRQRKLGSGGMSKVNITTENRILPIQLYYTKEKEVGWHHILSIAKIELRDDFEYSIRQVSPFESNSVTPGIIGVFNKDASTPIVSKVYDTAHHGELAVQIGDEVVEESGQNEYSVSCKIPATDEYKETEVRAAITLKKDYKPVITLSPFELTYTKQVGGVTKTYEASNLVADPSIEYRASSKVIAASPDGDILEGELTEEQKNIAKESRLTGKKYFGVASTASLGDKKTSNELLEGKEILSDSIKFTPNIGYKNSTLSVDLIATEVFSGYTAIGKLTPMSGSGIESSMKKYVEQRTSILNGKVQYNFSPKVSLRYVSSVNNNTYTTELKDESGVYSTEYYQDGSLKSLPDDVGVMTLFGTSGVMDFALVKCYSGDEVTIRRSVVDEVPSTTTVSTNLQRLSGIDGDWETVNDSYKFEKSRDINISTGESEYKFSCDTAGIYRLNISAIDERGAMSEAAYAYIRVYDPPTARLSTNPDLVYNPNNLWNTKEIIRFDISSANSGVDETFGDMWHAMDFSKDEWTIEPLDGQSLDDILIMELSLSDSVEPQNLVGYSGNLPSAYRINSYSGTGVQSADSFSVSERNGKLEKKNGMIVATNLPLGINFRQLTFLKEGRYRITYKGKDIKGKETWNVASEIVTVDRDVPPLIEGSIPSLYYRNVTSHDDGTKIVTGADLLLAGNTWDNALGMGNGATRITSVDGDNFYKVNINEEYDSNNDGTYGRSNGSVQLGPDYGYTVNNDGTAALPLAKGKITGFGRHRYLKASGQQLYRDNMKYVQNVAGSVYIRQCFNSSTMQNDRIYLQVENKNVSLLGKHRINIEAVEVPSLPVVRYVANNPDKYYKRAQRYFYTEVDNTPPVATYDVSEKPKLDVLVINNNNTDYSNSDFLSYKNNLEHKISTLDAKVNVFNTNNIKALYKIPYIDMAVATKGMNTPRHLPIAWQITDRTMYIGAYNNSGKIGMSFPILAGQLINGIPNYRLVSSGIRYGSLNEYQTSYSSAKYTNRILTADPSKVIPEYSDYVTIYHRLTKDLLRAYLQSYPECWKGNGDGTNIDNYVGNLYNLQVISFNDHSVEESGLKQSEWNDASYWQSGVYDGEGLGIMNNLKGIGGEGIGWVPGHISKNYSGFNITWLDGSSVIRDWYGPAVINSLIYNKNSGNTYYGLPVMGLYGGALTYTLGGRVTVNVDNKEYTPTSEWGKMLTMDEKLASMDSYQMWHTFRFVDNDMREMLVNRIRENLAATKVYDLCGNFLGYMAYIKDPKYNYKGSYPNPLVCEILTPYSAIDSVLHPNELTWDSTGKSSRVEENKHYSGGGARLRRVKCDIPGCTREHLIISEFDSRWGAGRTTGPDGYIYDSADKCIDVSIDMFLYGEKSKYNQFDNVGQISLDAEMSKSVYRGLSNLAFAEDSAYDFSNYMNSLNNTQIQYFFNVKFDVTDDVMIGKKLGDLWWSDYGSRYDLTFVAKDGYRRQRPLSSESGTSQNAQAIYNNDPNAWVILTNTEVARQIKQGTYNNPDDILFEYAKKYDNRSAENLGKAYMRMISGRNVATESDPAGTMYNSKYLGAEGVCGIASETKDINLGSALGSYNSGERMLSGNGTSFYCYVIGSNLDLAGNVRGLDGSIDSSKWHLRVKEDGLLETNESYKEVLLKYQNGYFTVLGSKDITDKNVNEHTVKISVNNDEKRIKVMRNGVKIFDIVDNEYLDGRKMMIHWQQNLDKGNQGEWLYGKFNDTGISTLLFSDVTIIDGEITPIDDVIKSNNWREGSDRYVVLAQQESYPGLDSTTEVEDKESAQAGILQSGANLITLYKTGSSETWLKELVNSVTSRGLFGTSYELTNDMPSATLVGDAILSKYSNKISKTWLLVGTPLVWDKHYSDYEGDPQLQESGYPPGTIETERWRFTHNKLVFANSHPYTNNLGDYANSGKWIPASPESFNQTGTYSVNFKIKDNPLGTYNASNPLNGYMYFSNNYDSVG